MVDIMRIEKPIPLPSGYYFGTLIREPNMKVSGAIMKAGEQVAIFDAGSIPELVTAALTFIWEEVQ